jgi:hypothetical protein
MPFATLDLGERESMSDVEATKHIQNVFSEVFYRKSQLMQEDLEFTVRHGYVCVPRLVDNDAVNLSILHDKQTAPSQLQILQ